MSTDAWEEIQAIKSKRNSLRERLAKRKKERQELLGSSLGSASPVSIVDTPTKSFVPVTKEETRTVETDDLLKFDPELESGLLKELSQVTLQLPVLSSDLSLKLYSDNNRDVMHKKICNLLEKFAIQKLIIVKDLSKDEANLLEVCQVEVSKVNAMILECNVNKTDASSDNLKRKRDDSPEISNEGGEEEKRKKEKKEPKADIMSLLSMPSTKEKESKKLGEEILDLLSKPTAKERSLTERFKSQGGKQLMEFCPHGTRIDCERNGISDCKKLHFKKILQKHTDESLGDCSFLNTCFHMDTCKYVHYEVDRCCSVSEDKPSAPSGPIVRVESTTLYPPQWVQCDLRYLDMTVLGKFAVIMADPPWDIHMELPYGTMSDDEMRQLGIPQLQDDGLIFLWVTGRAMELGRECLKLWGYERVDEIIWVKTNQLQRIIRTGRTGHWLNHGKEHCLVGMKGDPQNLNRGLDSDVIVAEVRATSHKPDEIYGMIERLSPGTRKIELFGRPHNIQPNWITLGNQVDGIRLVDPELIENFKKRYPTGNCMAPPPENTHPIVGSSNSSKWILELGDNFSEVRKDGGYWLVKFYTPWCGQCKRLDPIWAHVVQALKNTHIRIGRVDCTTFPNIGRLFQISMYPTIKLVKSEEDYTFAGDLTTEEIVNFAVRMSGPPVQHVSRSESLTNIKNMNQLFFMYVGTREGPLWNSFFDISSKMQPHAFYYSSSPEVARQHVDVHRLPSVFVHKESSHYFYTLEEGNETGDVSRLNASMHKWINEERFETFPRITESNFEEILRSGKYIVLVVVGENKLQQIPKEMIEFRDTVESLIRSRRDKYHRHFQFGWTSSIDLANNIAMELLTLPYLLVLNSTTMYHHLPEDEPTEMTADAIDMFLERIFNQSLPAYGGDNLFNRLYRTYFRTRSTLADRWRGNPVLTTVLLGLPLGFLSFILYSCCCADILDAEEDDTEVLHEKRE